MRVGYNDAMVTEVIADPIWVETPDRLKKMVADLHTHKRVAVDTESNSLHAYRERVCLIQFSVPGKDYLVDPLKLEDLHSLGTLFAAPGIEKIFHAAEYDLICLRRDFGFTFENLFDTMQAARVLGYTAVGLDKLLGERFGIEVDKRHQKADWAARPLTRDQIHYARLDTHYLIDLRDVMENELREKGRWELAQDDFRRAAREDESRPRLVAEAWERYSGRRELDVQDLAVLSELLACRQKIAAELDRPVFKVIDDERLITIARSRAGTRDDLVAAGLSEKQIRLWGRAVLAAVHKGMDAAPVERKPVKRLNDALLGRIDKLKAWRKKAAKEMGVESDIVLPKAYLQVLAEQTPLTTTKLKTMMADSPWRFQKFGEEIVKVLAQPEK